ncbi:ABC transporter permease [Dinghuibacter silviterrae]|uniref:ABC-type antimicrobial peptide transport system permease subunit n=1 Tax=Dinghuibacter silviterrae TaxID=1539049 RepID=A0A4R8DVW4_9BACT|nr:ABC transporter permease [Dinghuibacter silviterrae]TDX02349.1 ABC-type antimicrobial peptide transport system permease subunit [Dinghuibacter silviterrae]
MFASYLKTAWRALLRNKTSSLVNIGGLAVGMAAAMMIALWIVDELRFNRGFEHYDRIAQIYQHETENGKVETYKGLPLPLDKELKEHYGRIFKNIVITAWPLDATVAYGNKVLSESGHYMGAGTPELLSLRMIRGTRDGLKDPHSILLSASVAKAFFGDADPMNRMMKLQNEEDVKVTGVYADLPQNSDFSDLQFIAPWDLIGSSPWLQRNASVWDNNSFQILVQLADGVSLAEANAAIADIKHQHDPPEEKKYNARLFLHPMRDWHLRSNWENGVQTGGAIESVYLFGLIGVFVLLLACINFMNLSTARSEKRAREVGIRKTVGSPRGQLIYQFYIESFLVVGCAFAAALLLVQSSLPAFNDIAAKDIAIPWRAPWFWTADLAFVLLTGCIAGSYPALYLSAFKPVKVLKGRVRQASLPRKTLVVVQFCISLLLIIGTVVVYRQIGFTKDRPTGYDRSGLIMVEMKTMDFQGKFDLMRTELKRTGAVTEFAESSSPLMEIWQNDGGYSWLGKDPNVEGDFAHFYVTHEFGQTVGWQFVKGRNFSRAFASDSTAIVLNEAAIRFMGLHGDPIGMTVTWGTGVDAIHYHVIGVTRDMVMESPYEPVKQAIYNMGYRDTHWMIMRLSPQQSTAASLQAIEKVFKQYIPSAPFDYRFADQEYAVKFATEERIGKLAALLASLAIFISCLGLFGLASFVAEQRTKEIGVRKVLGASVFSLWRLLTGSFVGLVLVALCIAIPLSWMAMHRWLEQFPYHTGIDWWIFVAAGAGTVSITLATVTWQALRAALANPVRSLRAE